MEKSTRNQQNSASIPARDAGTYLYRPGDCRVAERRAAQPQHTATRRCGDAIRALRCVRTDSTFLVVAFRQAPTKRQVRWVFQHLSQDLLLWCMASFAFTFCATPSSAGECRPAEGRCGYRRHRGRLCRPFQVSGTYLPKLQSVQVRDQFTGVASMKLSWGLHRI